MKVAIELQEPELVEQVKPLADIAISYEGHLNYAYTRGQQYTQLDLIHKAALLEKLRAHPNAKHFVIGSGSGHIWVSVATSCNIETKELIANDWIHNRILLITDVRN